MLITPQCKTIRPLDEYLQEEASARTHNLVAFERELRMARSLFAAAQETYAHLPASDRLYWRVQASLLAATMKYFASSIDLCLRGSPAEAVAIMRSSVEHVAYIVRIGSDVSLAQKWVDLTSLKGDARKEWHAHFGRDTDLLKQPQIASAANPIYGLFSMFGVHARLTATEQAIDLFDQAGWKIRHAEAGTEHVRFFLLGILFAMRDLITMALVPSLLDNDMPEEVSQHLNEFEAELDGLGAIQRQFLRWIKNPQRPPSRNLVVGLSAVLVDDSP